MGRQSAKPLTGFKQVPSPLTYPSACTQQRYTYYPVDFSINWKRRFEGLNIGMVIAKVYFFRGKRIVPTFFFLSFMYNF